MMKPVKVEVNGESIYVKKDFLGWRVVEPTRDENGKLNLMHLIFGGKKNLIILVLLLAIAAFIYFGISDQLLQCKDIAAAPCNYCQEYLKNQIGYPFER